MCLSSWSPDRVDFASAQQLQLFWHEVHHVSCHKTDESSDRGLVKVTTVCLDVVLHDPNVR